MGHISKPTRWFLYLIIILLLTIIACLILGAQSGRDLQRDLQSFTTQKRSAKTYQAATKEPVNTATWKNYTSADKALSFKLPASWVVSAESPMGDFDTLAIQINGTGDAIKIYTNKTAYFAFDGLQQDVASVGNVKTGIKVCDQLYGVQTKNMHYTFDATNAGDHMAEFSELVKSVVLAE